MPQKKIALFVKTALALAFISLYQLAQAAYPDRPIKVIVPAGAGGAADATARVIMTALSQRIGQPIVIDNRPGAAGTIGLDAIAKARPDGYTIGTNSLSSYTMTGLLAKHLPYRMERDFSPIAMIASQPYLLGVNPALPIQSVKELISYTNARPEELFYGSSGNGSGLQVVMELFRLNTGVRATHVGYKTVVAAETDLMGGQIHLMFDNFSTMLPNVKSGRVRALATTGKKRSELLPDVPTVAQLGLPAVEAAAWSGVVGPSGIPVEIINKLNMKINAILSDPIVVKQLTELSSDAAPMSPEEFRTFLKNEESKWGQVIKRANITAE
jgi:tripartite-type tricarboxylate transporter receptor subunit TctC